MIITLNAQTVRAAAIFAGKDESRVILTTLYVEREDERHVRITATDSYRLVSFIQTRQEDIEPFDAFMISSEIYKQISTKDTEISFTIDPDKYTIDSRISAKGAARMIPFGKMTGNYPNYHNLLDQENEYKSNAAGLNSAYLIDLGKCMEIAFGKHTKKHTAPPLCIQIDDAMKPVRFSCSNQTLSCVGLIMPIRLA